MEEVDGEAGEQQNMGMSTEKAKCAMRLSTRMRYGCRAMAELAVAYPREAVSVREIAENQRLSVKYLEHIASALKEAGLVRAIRGMHGGYALCRPPAQISLSDILHALEGSSAPVECVDNPSLCPFWEICPTRETWVEMGEAIEGVLRRTTLQNLAERAQRKGGPPSSMYHI